jgi:Zn-dependent protease/CBS domain-containing protein
LAIKLGTIYGIPLYLDYTSFIIFALIVWSVGFVFIPSIYPAVHFSLAEQLGLGVLSAILLFASIIVHELAHSIVAKRNGLRIGRITVYLFGGVSEMEEEPSSPGLELKMSAAGPITSLAIAGMLGVLWYLSQSGGASVLIQGPLYYSWVINLIVAGFNLIPAFPLDGGRVLRSILWSFNHDILKATKIASIIGRIFAYLLMFAGIILFVLTGDLFDGIWLVLIGWFISSGATSELKQQIVQQDLGPLKISDIMTRNLTTVSPDMPLNDLSLYFMEKKHNGFPVVESDQLAGCVTMHDLRHTSRESWNTLRVRDIMVPKEKVITVRESDPAKKALQLMSQRQIGRVFVLGDYDSRLAGIVTRTDVMKTIETQENARASTFGAGSAAGGRAANYTISVESGMLFEVSAQLDGGLDWSAQYDSSALSLVSTKLVQLADSQQSKLFTFQALRKGQFFITLVPSTSAAKSAARAPRYSVIVN